MKKELTPMGFQIAANTYLSSEISGDANLLEIINDIKLNTDEQGSIETYVIENLVALFEAAKNKTPEAFLKHKFADMEKFLREYL